MKLKENEIGVITNNSSGHKFKIGEKVKVTDIIEDELFKAESHYRCISEETDEHWFVEEDDIEKLEENNISKHKEM